MTCWSLVLIMHQQNVSFMVVAEHFFRYALLHVREVNYIRLYTFRGLIHKIISLMQLMLWPVCIYSMLPLNHGLYLDYFSHLCIAPVICAALISTVLKSPHTALLTPYVSHFSPSSMFFSVSTITPVAPTRQTPLMLSVLPSN